MKKQLLFGLALCGASLMTQSQNIFTSGDLEDAGAWSTVLQFTDETSTVDFDFGSSYTPSDGSGKSFYLDVTDAMNTIQLMLYQEVTLKVGSTYQVDGLFKDSSVELNQFWAEFRYGLNEPSDTAASTDPSIIAFNVWDACGPNVDGSYLEFACKSDKKDANGDPILDGKFTVSDTLGEIGSSITAYVGIDFGSWSDAPMNYTVAVDNLSLTETESSNINSVAQSNYGLSIYPNPASNSANITFTLEKSSNVEIEIYNLVGKKIVTIPSEAMYAGSHTQDLNIGNLSSGSYFCKIKVNGKFQTQKITIIK